MKKFIIVLSALILTYLAYDAVRSGVSHLVPG